jgi:dTDP-4-amino-4,6-dideoxygalactose transaminase
MAPIQMVDLSGQYERIKTEIDAEVLGCIASTAYINGPQVQRFQGNLEAYLNVRNVIPCANGTDALQVAMMALGLEPGDEVIVPAFTYVATAEVIALLRLTPVMVGVDPDTFNVTADIIRAALTPRTKAVVPVHLFGQSAHMEPIMELAATHGLFVIEDNAQSLGGDYTFANGTRKKAGTVGHVGCTSFFPSKNLGAYGDGGAIFTDDDELAARLRMTVNHGQAKKYYHSVVGINSRLDSVQAAILNVKLKYLDEYCAARREAADYYDEAFADLGELQTPARQPNSTHVFHQYTLRVKDGRRDALQQHLQTRGIPSMIYYPVPLYRQEAFAPFVAPEFALPEVEDLCSSVLSLPIHTEMREEQLAFITRGVREFFAD